MKQSYAKHMWPLRLMVIQEVVFCSHTYTLGQEMMWWDKKDERFNEWHSYDNSAQENPIKNFEIEPCLTTCPSCGEELFVAVRFEFNKPVRITKVGKEQDLVWEEYYPAKE